MKLLRLALVPLAIAMTAACGGSSKPAAAPAAPAEAAPAPAEGEASCCCDYVKEEGDPESDTWTENQTYELMDPAGCRDLGGTCTDAAQCEAGAATP